MESAFASMTVAESFIEPALRVLHDYCRSRRDTPQLTDEQFLRGGVQRILGHCDSGRDFLQACQDRGETLARATWFDALHSPRRAVMVAEVATRSYEVFARLLQPRDWLGAFPELAGRAVWAVDGHHLEHACHAPRDPKGEFISMGLLYGLCLHTGLQRAPVPFQVDGVRHHEFPVFKQQLPRWLQQDRGPLLPIVVGDPAYIDVLYWTEQKRHRQAVIVTREKENMKPTVIAHHRFDRDDPVNRGVEADTMAGYTPTLTCAASSIATRPAASASSSSPPKTVCGPGSSRCFTSCAGKSKRPSMSTRTSSTSRKPGPTAKPPRAPRPISPP